LWYAELMTQSTITVKFQTTIPLEVRQALKLSPRQRVSYEVRSDGSAVLRPVAKLEELFGSVKLRKPVAGPRDEKRAARAAIAREASTEGMP
jgi:antitoxin PrlF